MKVFEKVMYPIFFLFFGFAIYSSHVDLKSFEENLVAQDGLFQWMIFSTLLFTSLMCFYRASILKPFRGPLFSLASIIFGIIFLGFALDEISWGQRIFNFTSPEFFQTHNVNRETNVHHLVLAGFYVNNIVFTLTVKIIATLYFLVLPFLYPRFEKLKSFVNLYAIPIPKYSQTILYIFCGLMVNFVASEQRNVIFEFAFYWIWVLMMYNPLNYEAFSRRSLVR